MKKWCLISGASSGIGRDLAECFAKNGYNILLVARSIDKLKSLSNNLKNQYQIDVKVISKDLSKVNSAIELKQEVTSLDIKIHTLINNAGVGYAGDFDKISYQKSLDMNILNIITLSNLCHLFVEDMKNIKGGQILNVASTAAFQPGPYMSAYYASKSFVLNYTLGIRQELKKKNISVTCLCPGATKTEFFNNESFKFSNLEKLPLISNSKDVAMLGYEGLINGKAIVIPGKINCLLAFFTRFIPYALIVKLISRINKTS